MDHLYRLPLQTEIITPKTILSKYAIQDPWFHIRYSMNLYRGCQHQCIYCDTRSKCYGIGNLGLIRIKENATTLLRKELSRLRAKDTIGTGSMNDPYMPVEKETYLCRQALEIISTYRFPVHIITKSNLVERDIDIIKKISDVFATVSFTITTADDTLSAIIEPGAPVSSLRFTAIKVLAEAGITTGITLMPVLPFICDTDNNITDIIHKAHENGAKYIFPAFGMTLRNHQKDYYFEKLKHTFPKAHDQYKKYYRGTYGFHSIHTERLKNLFKKECSRLGIATAIPAYKPVESQLSLFG